MNHEEKTKPSRIPVSKQYAERKYREGLDFGLYAAWVIMFTCMAEDLKFDHATLRLVFDRCNDKAESIRKGYCDVDDWAQVLREEYDINVGKAVLHP